MFSVDIVALHVPPLSVSQQKNREVHVHLALLKASIFLLFTIFFYLFFLVAGLKDFPVSFSSISCFTNCKQSEEEVVVLGYGGSSAEWMSDSMNAIVWVNECNTRLLLFFLICCVWCEWERRGENVKVIVSSMWPTVFNVMYSWVVLSKNIYPNAVS